MKNSAKPLAPMHTAGMPHRQRTSHRSSCKHAARRSVPDKVLVIACGALAQEIVALKERYGWCHLDMQCIDARLHNRPAAIPARLDAKLAENAGKYDRMFVAYADCGTGGEIDRVVEAHGAERLPGAHCYQFLAGKDRFAMLAEQEPGTFYLTDFLARHFKRFVIRPLKLDQHPELRDAYFGNYKRLVYLSQTVDEALLSKAQQAARELALEFEHVHCGYGELESGLKAAVAG